jgi:transcriptional regulator with XRE-family HTH domain
MAKGRKPKNERNPLRQLRECLSDKGRPITQEKLSDIIGISTSYVRAIEFGDRPLTAELDMGILSRTGAVWDSKAEHWAYHIPGGKPFNFGHYEEFREFMTQRPMNDVNRVKTLNTKMLELFKMLPDSHWHDLYFRYQSFVEDCCKDFDLPQLEEIYQSTVKGKDRSRAIGELSEYQQRLAKAGLQKQGWLSQVREKWLNGSRTG